MIIVSDASTVFIELLTHTVVHCCILHAASVSSKQHAAHTNKIQARESAGAAIKSEKSINIFIQTAAQTR